MNERTLIDDLHGSVDQEITVKGLIDVRRDHGKLIFLDIRDRSGFVQAVVLPNHTEALIVAQMLKPESSVSVKAKVNKRPEKMVNKEQPNGDIELELLNIEILSLGGELPFEKDADINLDTSLDNRPFTLRNTRNRAIFKVQHEILQAYRSFLVSKDFTEFEAPKIVGDDAEGGGNIFRVEYFKDRWAYLATSPQLYKQIMVGVFERVFSIGNVFRAELHSTSRHINEYTSLDVEMGFIKDHTDIMRLEEEFMQHLYTALEKNCKTELAIFKAELPMLPVGSFPSMKLREALALIAKETGEDCVNEPDLAPEHERWLSKYAQEHFKSDYIFITHYPVTKRPFYTYEDENDKGYTKSFDLLFRGVEITTGGQRIHKYDELVEKMKAKNLVPENFSFYLQIFKSGMPPHGGWGMGLERLTQKILGLENVKEATLFPREINRIDTLLSE
ncbi:MAG: Aspartyl-tRNA synthetase [Parcubacteria group bacterium GW2011_GWA2_43_11]|nr:MAG: Aspartyl-tRNA synthetase [Parcubacteria group bacterium GW2011_GWA2_43_11]